MFQSYTYYSAIIALLLSGTIEGANDTSSSVFVPASVNGPSSQFAFALNVDDDSNDLYFRLSGPSHNSWVAVGPGSAMAGSMLFVVYTSSNGKNITLSPRLATGHSEPSYSPDIPVSLLDGSGVTNGTYTANVHCRNCTSWLTGSLNLKLTAQSWIYAIGPSNSLKSDSRTATIQRHEQYGIFTLNMVQATGDGAVPTDTSMNSGAAAIGSPINDHDWTAIFHAVLTCFAFALMMPLGAVFLRVLGSFRWHWMNQIIASTTAFVGVGVGIYLSTTYNQSSSFSSAHQIIGILLTVGLAVQLFLGYFHHRIYTQTQGSTLYAVLHRYFGQLSIIVAVVNGGIGLSFASNDHGLAGYVVLAIIVMVLYFGILTFNRVRVNRKNNVRTFEPYRDPGATQYDSSGIHLNRMG
ncbi:hypothetical protein MMC14_005509 [Varicellaria rhodocarpa]|nr:hypothetical protein [Varicellaria rhodocarpa]